MTVKRFYLDRATYLSKLAREMPRISGSDNMFTSRSSNEEVYYMSKTDALFFYNGKNIITIGARNKKRIMETKSTLEKKAGIGLTEIR